MERIIINEIDNTTYYENLSSYDVVYVPGFASVPSLDHAKLYYRNPTLVTNKYEFIQMFGHSAGYDPSSTTSRDIDIPRFKTNQYLPPAGSGESNYGFPEYARPNARNTAEEIELVVNNFETVEDISTSQPFGRVDLNRVNLYTNVSSRDFVPTTGSTYFRADIDGETKRYKLTSFDPSTITTKYHTPVTTEVFPKEGFDDLIDSQGAYKWPTLDKQTIRTIEFKDLDVIENENYSTGETKSSVSFTDSGRWVYYDVGDVEYEDTITLKTYFPTTIPDGEEEPAPVEEDFPSTRRWLLGCNPHNEGWAVEVDSSWVVTADTYIHLSETDPEDDPPTVTPAVEYNIETIDYSNIYIFESSSPAELGLKELVENDYITSSDTAVDLTKRYYYTVETDIPTFYGESAEDAGDGDPDIGFRYALTLLSLGIPVYYEQMNLSENEGDADPDTGEILPGITLKSMYDGLRSRFTVEPDSDYSFDNIGDYAIKYVTSGGYPTYEYGELTTDASGRANMTSHLANAMITLCRNRGDAIALIDHTNNPSRPITSSADKSSESVIDKIRGSVGLTSSEYDSYGAMFTPWYQCSHPAVVGTDTWADNSMPNPEQAENNPHSISMMPASLAFLTALAVQIQNYNPWLAVAGVTRGKVPYCAGLNLTPPIVLTNNVANSYQSLPDQLASVSNISINPITYIRNYGYCIWGNRTLRNNTNGTKASSFLHIRNVVSDIKKKLYETSQSLLFDQNSEVLWVDFKTAVTPILDKMVSNYILTDYKLTKLNIDPDTGKPVPPYKLVAILRIMPINAVEVFDLTVQLENSVVEFVEEE